MAYFYTDVTQDPREIHCRSETAYEAILHHSRPISGGHPAAARNPTYTAASAADPPGITVELVKHLPIGGASYFSTLWWLTHPAGSPPATSSSALPADNGRQPRDQSVRATPYAVNDQLTTNSVKDAEPTTIVQQTAQGTFSTTVAIQAVSDTNFFNVAHTIDSNGYQYPDQTLPFPSALEGWTNPTGYHVTGDPLLTENPYNYGTAPKRMYAVGVAHSGAVYAPPTGIALWRSDDGGRTWSRPAHVAQSNAYNVFYDKPAVTTCWYYQCVGEVYVAYTYYKVGTFPEIHVARSTDGGLNFYQDVMVAKGPGISTPQIVSDYWYGTLYVLWQDFSNNRIVSRTSSDRGVTWDAESVVANTSLRQHNDQLPDGLAAQSTIMARYNINSRQVNVVWHANGAYSLDLLYATNAGGPWYVNYVQGVDMREDQFFPALDYDNTGNVLISYYSRRDDTVYHRYYRPYYVMITSDNSTVVHNETSLTTVSFDPDATNEAITGWIGDYQDVWFAGELGRFQPAWIGRPANGYEVFLTTSF